MNAQELSFRTLLLELICSVVFLITFFLTVPVTVWSALLDVKVRDREEIKNGLDVTSCSLSYHLVKSDHTCSRRCRRPSAPSMLRIVLWVQHRVVRTVQCFQLLKSRLVILC